MKYRLLIFIDNILIKFSNPFVLNKDFVLHMSYEIIYNAPYQMGHIGFKTRLNILQSVDLFLRWLLQVQLFSPSKPKYHPIECYLRFLVDKDFEDFEMDFVSFYYFDDFSFLFEFSTLIQFQILTDGHADNLWRDIEEIFSRFSSSNMISITLVCSIFTTVTQEIEATKDPSSACINIRFWMNKLTLILQWFLKIDKEGFLESISTMI